MEAARKGTHGEGSSAGDRLSALPDDLLHTILSSLKAGQVVQTSVLSRRWKCLWRSVPCLRLDQREFESTRGLMSQERDLEKFEDFGDFLFAHRDGTALDTFILRITKTEPRCIDTDRWIRRALTCSLKALHIHSNNMFQVKMPPDLGSSSCCLTRLHFYNILLDDDFAELIYSVCMVLEDLELKECELYFHTITSTSLRNLIMVGGDQLQDGPLIITAPHLSSLLLILWGTSVETSVNEMLSLVKATIRFESLYLELIDANDQFGLLSNVFNVESLELSGFLEMVLSERVKFPTFKNLRILLLDDCDLSNNFQLLRHFLQNAPNLEKLAVRCCELPKGLAGGEGRANFQCQELKSIEIIYRDQDIRELVCFLLDVSGRVPKNSITLTKV